ncbi:hypothetical protein [Flavihumibacter petaseus]|uniref:Uncharacterized protein n=1 Tax=Flavihumibacter petaseus NBRC 106054 TaxID=1220578 RepID=A0A0E9N1B5_9BACT|nr:hypothetical protein [Flavihumibacter petaseus]GAO43426.1 hypothetical protein FPE01S_02_05310 [Flavihumibacter petaseus NBRC 106054]
MKTKMLLAGLLFLQGLTAQKVDLDRFSFSVAYRDLPRQPIDSGYHTYAFQLQTGPLMRVAREQARGTETLYIEGWMGVVDGADIAVSLVMEDLVVTKSAIAEREEVKKDKEGKIISARRFYAPVLTYYYAARMELRDRQGRTLQSRQLVTRNQSFQYTGPEKSSRAEVSGLMMNSFDLTGPLSYSVVTKTIRDLSVDLTNSYGYAERRISDQVWVLDSRQHPEYEAFRQHWGNVKNGLILLQPDVPLDDVKRSIASDITYFESLPDKYSGRSKADRKLRYAAYYMLAKIHYYLDNPGLSATAATSLVLNDYDSRDGKYLEAAALELMEIFRINKRHSRHFPLYFDGMAATNQ